MLSLVTPDELNFGLKASLKHFLSSIRYGIPIRSYLKKWFCKSETKQVNDAESAGFDIEDYGEDI